MVLYFYSYPGCEDIGLTSRHYRESSDRFVLQAIELLYIQKCDTFRNGLNGEH